MALSRHPRSHRSVLAMFWERLARPAPRSGRAVRGLTGSHRPLYSAGFATPACGPASERPCGGIGRRARLKIEFRKECWFDSGQGHQIENISNNINLDCWFDSIFPRKFSSGIENTPKRATTAVRFVGIFVGIEGPNAHREFRYSERGNRANGSQERWRERQPEHVDCQISCDAAKSLIWLLRILHASFPARDLRFPSGP